MNSSKSRLLKLLFGIFQLLYFVNFAGVIYVNDDAPCSACDGTSWANAYQDLQLALTASTANDTIWLAEGVYHPDASDRLASFYIKNGIKMYGGFNGSETSITQRNHNNFRAYLSGDLLDNDSPTNIDTTEITRHDNSMHVVIFNTAVTNSTIIDGVFITGGHAFDVSNPLDWYPGGGMEIYNNNADPIIRNCHFENNVSTYGGAALETYGKGTFENCVFQVNCTVADANGGGAIKVVSTSTTLFKNCTMRQNVAKGNGSGGAVLIQNNSHPAFLNCSFLDNITNGSNNEGGAVYIVSTGNAAHGTFTNCIFANNSAVSGGAINMWGSVADFYNCTFYNHNFGVFFVSNGGSISQSPKVYNSILYGNTGTENNNSSFKPEYYSCVLQSSTCAGNLCNCCIFNEDPLFVDPATNDFSIQNGSPAVNTGNNAHVSETTDYNGSPRIYLVVDIGAVESSHTQDAEVLLADTTTNSIVDDNYSVPLEFRTNTLGDTVSKVIKISNSGGTSLLLCSYQVTGDFSVIEPPVYDISASQFTFLTIKANASAEGISTGVLTIVNNDVSEGVYEINLRQIVQDTVSEAGEVVIYPGISPNGDGKNDYLRIDNIEQYPSNELLIYDRMGNLIASFTKYNNTDNNWKGKFKNGNNERVVNGTYYYVLRLDENSEDRKGFLVVQD